MELLREKPVDVRNVICGTCQFPLLAMHLGVGKICSVEDQTSSGQLQLASGAISYWTILNTSVV
jgi:hypothetical protein